MTNLVRFAHDSTAPVSEAIDLCTRCGACETACGIDQPVVSILDEARTKHQPTPASWSPPTIEGEGSHVAIICQGNDWSDTIRKQQNLHVAKLYTDDHLGEPFTIRTDTRSDTYRKIRALIGDRTAIVTCHTCMEALTMAECRVVHLKDLLPSSNTLPQWRTCRCEPGPGLRTLVTCCGAKAPLATRHPDIAEQVAKDLHRRFDGQAVYIEDSRCSAHLRAVGAQVIDCIDRLHSTETSNANR